MLKSNGDRTRIALVTTHDRRWFLVLLIIDNRVDFKGGMSSSINNNYVSLKNIFLNANDDVKMAQEKNINIGL